LIRCIKISLHEHCSIAQLAKQKNHLTLKKPSKIIYNNKEVCVLDDPQKRKREREKDKAKAHGNRRACGEDSEHFV
jgi:hypothetical protein